MKHLGTRAATAVTWATALRSLSWLEAAGRSATPSTPPALSYPSPRASGPCSPPVSATASWADRASVGSLCPLTTPRCPAGRRGPPGGAAAEVSTHGRGDDQPG
jgi:hypothetical protein